MRQAKKATEAHDSIRNAPSYLLNKQMIDAANGLILYSVDIRAFNVFT